MLFTLYRLQRIDIFILHSPPAHPAHACLNNEIIVVGGWCYCTHYFVLGPIYCVRTCLVRRTWGLSYLGVVAVAAAAVVIDVFSTLLRTW